MSVCKSYRSELHILTSFTAHSVSLLLTHPTGFVSAPLGGHHKPGQRQATLNQPSMPTDADDLSLSIMYYLCL